MGEFYLYFELGAKHIANLGGLDHILFIAALCIRYRLNDWKQILVMATAFTIGHSITLALSVFNVLHFPASLIEFLIPLTILITALSNLFVKHFSFNNRFPVIYYLALFFGLIHGMGFSSYLKSLLGRNETIVTKLLAFNIGLEAGQLLIVAMMLGFSFLCLSLFKFNRREYVLFLSGGVAAIALEMMLQRI